MLGVLRPAVVPLIMLASAGLAGGAEFVGLGNEEYYTFPTAISRSGRVVVGAASSIDVPDTGALFRWTPRRGLNLLSEPGEESGAVSGVSGNGRVLVGYFGGGFPLAHRWTRADGWQPLGDLPGGDDVSTAHAVSGNGSVVVGASRAEPRAPWSTGWQAFRWTEKQGMQTLKYSNPDHIESSAADISPNGRFIVGAFTTASANTYSFRWSKRTGMQPLAGDPGNSSASAVSDDGLVVAGVSMGGFGPFYQAYRWTEAGGMQGLGYVSVVGPHPSSAVTDMSGDGSKVVGYSFDGNTEHDTVPFIWDEARGMRSIQQMLIADYGLGESLEGWQLISNAYISGNGQVLTGVGRNPEGRFEAWRADLGAAPTSVIPEPRTLLLSISGLLCVCLPGIGAMVRRHSRRAGRNQGAMLSAATTQ